MTDRFALRDRLDEAQCGTHMTWLRLIVARTTTTNRQAEQNLDFISDQQSLWTLFLGVLKGGTRNSRMCAMLELCFISGGDCWPTFPESWASRNQKCIQSSISECPILETKAEGHTGNHGKKRSVPSEKT